MRALLGGRVAAVPVHFDQAEAIVKQGNYKVMIEPWQTFSTWYSQAWLVQAKWLDKPENQRAAVDLNKAMITAFRRTNAEFDYFAAGFRKYATVTDAAKATDDDLKPIWQKLSRDIKAWPNDGGFRREDFRALLPVYRQAGAVKAEPNVDRVIDTRFVEQALKRSSDDGDEAYKHAQAGNAKMSVILAMLVLLQLLNNPFHEGFGGLQPVAMERALRIIDQELAVAGRVVQPPCDAQGNPL